MRREKEEERREDSKVSSFVFHGVVLRDVNGFWSEAAHHTLHYTHCLPSRTFNQTNHGLFFFLFSPSLIITNKNLN